MESDLAEMYQTNVTTGYKRKLIRLGSETDHLENEPIPCRRLKVKMGEAVRPVQFVWPAHLLSMLKNVYQKNNMHREMVTANMG